MSNRNTHRQLFQAAKPGENDLYGRIRDDTRARHIKERLESIWCVYQPYAPKSFRTKFQFEFPQRWWEMYLTVGLLNIGANVTTFHNDQGPDARVLSENTTIWIEAVAPQPGNNSDAVPEQGEDGDLPIRELVLRLAQGISSKRSILAKYISTGPITNSDCCIIAISAADLNGFGVLLDYRCPAMLTLLAGAGSLAIPLTNPGTSYFRKESTVLKNSSTEIPIALFDSADYNLISAVLYSSTDIVNSPQDPESTFELFLNPTSAKPLPNSFLEKMTNWSRKAHSNGKSSWEKQTPNHETPIHQE